MSDAQPTPLITPTSPITPSAPALPSAPAGTPGLPEVDESTRFLALLVARCVIGLYLLELIANLLRPHVLENEPVLSVLTPATGGSDSVTRLYSTPRLTFWALLLGLVIAVVLQVVAARTSPTGPASRKLFRATLLALVVPFSLIPLGFVGVLPVAFLACVPSTALALWLVHRGQQFGRLPARVLLAAFAWGAVIAWGISRACTNLAFGTVQGFLLQDKDLSAWTSALATETRFMSMHLGVIAVLGEAAGILLVLQLLRRRAEVDLLTGLSLGAAIGIGYNFSESAVFVGIFGKIGALTGATAGFEFWIRQCVTLLGSHCAIGAILGAGFALATQLPDRRRRRTIIGAVLLMAIGTALANELLTAWIDDRLPAHRGGIVDTLIVSPGIVLLVQAPAVVICLLLLRSGLQQRLALLQKAVEEESGSGAIDPVEAPVLSRPVLRWASLVATGRQHGWEAARALRRVQSAQLHLVSEQGPDRAEQRAEVIAVRAQQRGASAVTS